MVCTMSLVWINAIWHIFISGERPLLQVFPCSGAYIRDCFSKLAELWMVNILNGQTDFKLRIEGSAIRETILVFLVIFILILLSALRK